MANERYTLADTPPVAGEARRRSRWADMFQECREHQGEWRRIREPLKRSTAAQIASDIRNAEHRDLSKVRMKGFLEGDRWEAVWANAPDDPDKDNYYIWLRYLGSGRGSR